MTNLREQRQKEFSDAWLKTKFGILYLCPRFGKIKTSINCLRHFKNPKVLIIYPIETIKTSWIEDFNKWEYQEAEVTYVTTASLWKFAETPEKFDVIIADEIHAFSYANLQELKKLIDFGNKVVLALSGTISIATEQEVYNETGLSVLAEYPIEQAIKEKVITDYEITVIMTELDAKIQHCKMYKASKSLLTEKQAYFAITKKIEDISSNLGDPGLLRIQRMHILKRSVAKLEMTKRLIDRFKEERILVFCGLTDIANSLGIPVYHSKNKDKKLKQDFCAGVGNHLATVDMFEAGVTVKPINRAIINSFDSNPENLSQRISRLTGFEYDNPDKKAKVYIICTDTVEKRWLSKALEFFDQSKVKYVKII
jgi:superfamily II DNA or RNA helicase